MILEVRHLKLIANVAQAGNLTRAAEVLHLTQSALSHQLLDLEERLGTEVFSRVGKRMLLTQAGERILVSADRILDDLSRAEEDVLELAAGRAGTLHLTTECYTCYHWLPPLLKEFQMKHPGVEVSIDVDATDHPLEAILNAGVDLAIVSSKVKDARVEFLPLFDDELLVIMASQHRLASKAFIEPSDFAGETLLTYSALEDSTVYQEAIKPAGIAPKKHLAVRLTEATIELVHAGMGVALLARWAVEPQLRTGYIVGRPLTKRGYRRQWHAAFLRNTDVREFIEDFVALAQPRCESLASVRRRRAR